MARNFIISRKLYDLNCQLGRHAVDVRYGDESGIAEAKSAAYDCIFSLNENEQAKLFEYRAFVSEKADERFYGRYANLLEDVARFLGHEDFNELLVQSMLERRDSDSGRIDPNKRVDTGKMVSEYFKEGQQSPEGKKLKRLLDETLNCRGGERVSVID
jgi:hypothetical protein